MLKYMLGGLYDLSEIGMLSGLRFCHLHNRQLAFDRSRTPTLISGYVVCTVDRDSNTYAESAMCTS